MSTSTERQQNQAAFRRLKNYIQQSYPAGRFIAIAEGSIVADAPSFDELDAALNGMGKRSAQVLVVQSGVDYPTDVVIFSQG